MSVDPITAQLAALRVANDQQRARQSPRIQTAGNGERYFLGLCPHCGTTDYHHLEPLTGSTKPASRLELASCEGCGVLTSWKVLDLQNDGSARVLGPDWGAEKVPHRAYTANM